MVRLEAKIEDRKAWLCQYLNNLWEMSCGYIPDWSWGSELANDRILNLYYSEMDLLIARRRNRQVDPVDNF